MTNNKTLILSAQAVSLLFSPFYMPTIIFAILMMFSYLNLMSVADRLTGLVLGYLLTVILPRLCIFLYR